MLRTAAVRSRIPFFYENPYPWSNTLSYIFPYYDTHILSTTTTTTTYIVHRYYSTVNGTKVPKCILRRKGGIGLVIGEIVGEDKEQLKVYLPRSVIRIFKHEIALDRPTISRGMLSTAVEDALNHYIVLLRKRRSSMQQTARMHQNARELDDLLDLRDRVIEYMKSQTKIWPEGLTEHITEKHLLEAIASIKGAIDSRTSKKWRDRLFRANLINRTGPREYVFEDLPQQQQARGICIGIDTARARGGA